MAAIKKNSTFAVSDFADGGFRGERAIAALRGNSIGVVAKSNGNAATQNVATIDAAVIIQLLQSGKDEDLRAIADLLTKANKMSQGSLNELLRLMMLRGVGSFEQDWLGMIPDGIYTLDGRQQSEWVVRTVHMLLLIQQQQRTLFPSMPISPTTAQSFMQLQQMETRMYQLLRHPDPSQIQARLRDLADDRQNRAAIATARDFARENPNLTDVAGYQKTAIALATPALRDLNLSSQQFQALVAELARTGKLNPSAMAALAMMQPALARMTMLAQDIPQAAPNNTATAALQLFENMQRLNAIMLATRQAPLSPSMQQAIQNLMSQMNAAQTTPWRNDYLLPRDNGIIANITDRNTISVAELPGARDRLTDPINPPRDVLARIGNNGVTPISRDPIMPQAASNDPWANVIPLPIVRDNATSSAPRGEASVISISSASNVVLNPTSNDNRADAATYRPAVVSVTGDTRVNGDDEWRRVFVQPQPRNTPGENNGFDNRPNPEPLGRGGNVSAPTAGDNPKMSRDEPPPAPTQDGKYTPSQSTPGAVASPIAPPDQPIVNNPPGEYKPAEKSSNATGTPAAPENHICGPGCKCKEHVGQEVKHGGRRPPMVDADVPKTPEPERPAKCIGCNGEKGCCGDRGRPISSTGGDRVPTLNKEPSLNAAAEGTGSVAFKPVQSFFNKMFGHSGHKTRNAA